MAKHKATYVRTPLRWHRRRLEDQWYNYRKPALLRRLRAIQSQIEAFVRKYK